MNINFFNCDHIIIQSEYFLDLISNQAYRIELSIDINCCGQPFVKELMIDDIVSSSYLVSLDYFGFEEFLPTGVYQFDLKVYYGTDENNIHSIQGTTKCKFHNCEFTCQVIDHVANTEETDAHLLLNLLESADECPCQCENMCEIYNLLLKELNKDSNNSDTLDKCWTCKN